MPYAIRKVPNKSCYRVYKAKSKKGSRRIFSKCATKKNAENQLRLLRALQYNKNFVLNKTRKLRK
jgi:hypothetical protein